MLRLHAIGRCYCRASLYYIDEAHTEPADWPAQLHRKATRQFISRSRLNGAYYTGYSIERIPRPRRSADEASMTNPSFDP